MTHEIEQLDAKGLRKFGLLTGTIVVVLFGMLLPWLFNHDFPLWPWYIAGGLWVLSLLVPISLNPIYHIWMRIGLVLGWINTRIILGLLFYFMFTPASIILKIIGKDSMRRKREPGANSYRVQSTNQPREHMEKPF